MYANQVTLSLTPGSISLLKWLVKEYSVCRKPDVSLLPFSFETHFNIILSSTKSNIILSPIGVTTDGVDW
jgi:hypothetical protein